LKAPDIFVKVNGKEELSDVYVRILQEVFDRFSFEGRMGEI
jgi:hypothetical protein